MLHILATAASSFGRSILPEAWTFQQRRTPALGHLRAPGTCPSNVRPARPRPLPFRRTRRTGAPFTTRLPDALGGRSSERTAGGGGGPRALAGSGVAMSHGHSHGGGGCRCAAEREEPPEQRGLAYGLYLRIDLDRLQCLNESLEGSGRGVFKPWEERTDRSKVGLLQGLGRAGDAGTRAGSPAAGLRCRRLSEVQE